MARFFARLVGGVFLRARIAQHVAERGRERQRALLAVQDRRQDPARGLVDELDLLLSVSFSPNFVCRSRKNSAGMMYSFSMSNGSVKSMYFLSSGSQKWSWVAEMILSKAVERAL